MPTSAESHLFQGAYQVHANNRTHTTYEGYISDGELNKYPELVFRGKNTIYNDLTKGVYKISIRGTMYVFILLDDLINADKLVVNDFDDAYYILSLQKRRIHLYEAHDYTMLKTIGYELKHTINDYVTALIIDGYTKYDEREGYYDFKHPRKIDLLSTFEVKMKDYYNNEYEYILSMRNYLKSISIKVPGKSGIKTIKDRVIIDAEKTRALFQFKLGYYKFTGEEIFIKLEEYSTNGMALYLFPNTLAKINGQAASTHFKTITWDQAIDPEYNSEGICTSGLEDNPGICFKVANEYYPDENTFASYIQWWFFATEADVQSARDAEYANHLNNIDRYNLTIEGKRREDVVSPVYIIYEYANVKEEELLLDTYRLPTFYPYTELQIAPYKSKVIPKEFFDGLIGVVPKSGFIKSEVLQAVESGNPEMYQKILDENFILRGYRPYSNGITNWVTDAIEDENIPINGFVAVIPKDGSIKSEAMQELESGIAEAYDQILQENDIIRDLFAKGKINRSYLRVNKHMTDRTTPIVNRNDELDDTVGLVPKNGVIKTEAEQELESGEASQYQSILNNNKILRNILASSRDNVNEEYNPLVINETTVAVIPRSGIIPTEEYQSAESGDPSKYDEINQKNVIWRNLILKGQAPNDFIKSFKKYGVDIEDLYTVGVIPKDGIMKTEYLHTLESGIAAAYEDILRDNHILRNGFLVTGEYKIKTSYFYRHLLYKK